MGGSDWALRLLGAFHAVGGLFLLKQLADGRLIDAVLAALSQGPRWTSRVRDLLLTCGGILTVLGGAALLGPVATAVPLMFANLGIQVIWLAFSSVWFPPEDDEDRIGRRRTTNAFVLYLAASVAVVWAERQGWIGFVDDSRIDGALALVAVGLAIWQGWSALRWESASSGVPAGTGLAEEEPGEPARFDPPTRLLLQPSVGCWPLWDAETGRNLAPEVIGLPEVLVARIAAFEGAVIDALDVDHDDGPRIADPQVAASFEPEALAITRGLAEIFGEDNVAWRLPGED